MKNNINEQTMTSIDLLQARDTYKCPFVLGSSYVKTNYYTDGAMKKTANTDSKTPGNFVVGDILMIKKDFTYDVIRDGKIVKSNLKWACSTLNKDVVLPQISADQMKSVDDLITKYPGMYQKETPTADQLKTGEWKKINLKDRFPDQFKFDYNIYEKGGLRQTKSPQQEKIIATYVSRGWKDLGGKINPAEIYKYEILDLKGDYSTEFTEDYILVRPIESIDTSVLIKEMNNFVSSKNFGDRKTCKKGINTYLTLWKKNQNNEKIPVDKATLTNWKLAIKSCDVKVKNFNDFNITNGNLEKIKGDSTSVLGLGKPDNTSTQTNENTINLKNLIRESLIETKKTKERNVLSEGKIVKARLSIISENVSLKTKKQKNKFFDELLSEMTYLNSQGFDKKIINEGFWDTLKGLFGHAPDGIMEYFKEYIAKWLVEHLTPMDSNGWLGSIVITAIGNLPIGDIPKLTDCNFLTKLISKSVAEGTVRKLTHEKGLEGPFYDILRNSIVDMLDETSLGSKIEEALGSFICPLLGGVKNKMNVATDTLKQKALATS